MTPNLKNETHLTLYQKDRLDLILSSLILLYKACCHLNDANQSKFFGILYCEKKFMSTPLHKMPPDIDGQLNKGQVTPQNSEFSLTPSALEGVKNILVTGGAGFM